MTTAKATAAPLTVTIGERTWRVHPLVFSDLGEFEVWSERQVMRTVLTALSDVDEEIRKTLGAGAIFHAPNGPEASASMFSTLRGQVFLAWLSLRHGEPDMTLADAYTRIPGRETAEQIVDLALELSMPEGTGDKTARPF